MKLNIHILFDELKDFSPRITTSKDIDLTLRQIRLFSFVNDKLRTDCIYLLEASELEKNARLLRGIDLITIGQIDLHNPIFSDLSVILLPEACDKVVVLDAVQDIFEKYEQWDDGLMWSVAANESLQTVADKAASILANPFSLLDITLEMILKGGTVPENYKGTIWEVILEKGYTPSETYSLAFDDLYFFLQYDNKPYFRNDLPFTQYAHLIANLYLDGKPFALLCTTDIVAPLTQGQVSLIKHIRDIIELAIASSIEFKGSTESVFYYLKNLIKGFPVDEKILSYHMGKRGWSVCDKFRLYAIANPDGKELSDGQAKFCIYRIKKLQENVIAFTYENFIIVIANLSKNGDHNRYQAGLSALLPQLGLHCGCSQVFERFSDLRNYYIQSKAALYEGEKSGSKSVLWDFGEHFFSHVINLLSSATSLASLCHPNILRLWAQDRERGTDYVRCLRIYLFNGCNIAQTGKALFMHRNTLAYRLEKIAEIIEIDVQELSENERMQLWISCLISSYL